MRKNWGKSVFELVIKRVKTGCLPAGFSQRPMRFLGFPDSFRVFSQTPSTIVFLFLPLLKVNLYPLSTNLITIKIYLNNICFSGGDWRMS